MRKFIVALMAVFALVLTGCSTSTTIDPSPSASAAQPVQNPAPATEESKNGTLKFGDVMTWKDGISISVSEPTPFEPGANSAGAVAGQTNVLYTIVLTNGTDKPLEPFVSASVSSGGAESNAIFDMGNPLGAIGDVPRTVVLPGQTVKWVEGYSLADPNAVTLQVAPTFSHNKAIFTNIK